MSQQPPHSSPEYTSPPGNQLQFDSSDDKQNTRGLPATFKGKPINEVLSEFTPFNTKEHLEQPFQAESQRDSQFIHEQSLEFLEFALEVWARTMARIPLTTQAEGVRLGELLGTVLDSERQQGMSAPLILSKSARPPRTAFQYCTDFFAAMCKKLEDFLLRFRSLASSLRGT